MRKCGFTSEELATAFHDELRGLRYTVQHSRHKATPAGPAPNTTTKQYEPEKRTCNASQEDQAQST